MYRDALVEQTIDPSIELVALCDPNPSRLELSASRIPDDYGTSVGLYDAGEFDRMIAERRPDTIIVTTPDFLHDTYVVQALRAGCDVITEKPMTIDLARLKRIVDAQRETGRSP
jgi:predicted dehydrogenase